MNKVFVYGTLKKGHGNHRLLGTSKFLGADKTKDSTYYMYSLGGFPAVSVEGTTQIKGEVYEVDEPTMGRLDMLEGYPTFYDRKQVVTEKGHTAWMYFIDHSKLTQRYNVQSYIEEGEW